MESNHVIRLTAPEIASLWTTYITDSMAICVQKHVLEKVEDTEIRSIYEFALSLSETHIEKIKQIFTLEKFPIPHGFTDEDIHFGAPRLFSDIFWLMYLNKMAINGLTGYALALTTSTREDIRDFFKHVNHSTIELYNKCTNLKLSKGIFMRPPAISIPDKVEFVQKQSFLTGWFGDRRPLNAIEISHMGLNLKKSILKQALFLGFAQVASSKKVRDYLTRAKDVVSTHI